jgi:hypothetical protein
MENSFSNETTKKNFVAILAIITEKNLYLLMSMYKKQHNLSTFAHVQNWRLVHLWIEQAKQCKRMIWQHKFFPTMP